MDVVLDGKSYTWQGGETMNIGDLIWKATNLLNNGQAITEVELADGTDYVRIVRVVPPDLSNLWTFKPESVLADSSPYTTGPSNPFPDDATESGTAQPVTEWVPSP